VAVIDRTGKYASLFKDVDNYHFINSDKPLDDYKNSDNKETFAILNITADLLQNPEAATLYSAKQVPGELSRLVNQALTKQLESDKMASFQIPGLEQIIKDSRISFKIQTIKWSGDGSETRSSSSIAYLIGLTSMLIIYMFILMYGAMVMQGVSEEKTNRIVEIIVSSVRPFDLMMGKIIALGLVGLTQLFIWGILVFVLSAIGGLFFGISGGGMDLTAVMQQGALATSDPAFAGQFEWLAKLQSFNFHEIMILFIIFFAGGYLLYASIFAAIGSVIDTPEDSQQFMMPIILIMVFALYAGMYSMDNPDGPLAFWCSLIPFTSPIVIMMRIPYGIPLWQELLSVVILYATSIGFVWISAKIYRIGILIYGKKPRLKDIVKWISFQ
jgi:ABC-2 type transport system permease protein